jgi:sulfonate dioxygenase
MSYTTTSTQTGLVDTVDRLTLRGGELSAKDKDYKYARYLPTYDHSIKLPPLEPFEHVDPGHAAKNDPNPRAFLEGATETHLTPKFGTEVEGIQLSKLDQKAKS